MAGILLAVVCWPNWEGPPGKLGGTPPEVMEWTRRPTTPLRRTAQQARIPERRMQMHGRRRTRAEKIQRRRRPTATTTTASTTCVKAVTMRATKQQQKRRRRRRRRRWRRKARRHRQATAFLGDATVLERGITTATERA